MAYCEFKRQYGNPPYTEDFYSRMMSKNSLFDPIKKYFNSASSYLKGDWQRTKADFNGAYEHIKDNLGSAIRSLNVNTEKEYGPRLGENYAFAPADSGLSRIMYTMALANHPPRPEYRWLK